MDNTQKFSGLAEDYAAGRPAYAHAFIDSLYAQYGLSERSVIADIGAGTGKLAKQLLDRGSFVYCVEPNDDMRRVAIGQLGGHGNFRCVAATAEATGLAGKSVDFITAAQAFHWFDIAPFKMECKRILKDSGKVFLIWNMRDMSSPVNQDSFAIYTQYCPDFQGFGGGLQKDDVRIRQFFEDKYECVEFDNPLFYDRDTFISRSLSGSYSLRPGDEKYGEYLDALRNMFAAHAKDGVITIANKTIAYIGSLE